MKKESLIKAKEIIINALDKEGKNNIDAIDNCELMINIHHFLNEDKYEENVKVLSKHNLTKSMINDKI